MCGVLNKQSKLHADVDVDVERKPAQAIALPDSITQSLCLL